MPFVDRYPEKPAELDNTIWQAVYANDPPNAKFIYRYETLAVHVPLRKTSRLLNEPRVEPQLTTTPAFPWQAAYYNQQVVPWNSWQAGYSPSATWDDSWHDRRPKARLAIEDVRMAEFKPAESKPSSSSQKLPLSIMDASAESADQGALEDGIIDAPVTEGTDPSQAGKVLPRRSSADIEEAAFQCLIDKKNNKKTKKDIAKQPKKDTAKQPQKKPAAATSSVKQPEVMKKPAAAMKRPAAAMASADFEYNVDWVRGEHRDRRTFVSLHFHRVKNRMEKADIYDATAIMATCADVLARAGKLWDQHHK